MLVQNGGAIHPAPAADRGGFADSVIGKYWSTRSCPSKNAGRLDRHHRRPISELLQRMRRHAVFQVILAVAPPLRLPFARRIWPKCRTQGLPVRRAELFSG